MEKGLQEWSELAKKAKSQPSADLIPRLGTGLLKTSQTSIYVIGDRLGVRKELQEAILAIPGHAEYYQNRINIARNWLDKAYADSTALGVAQNSLRNEQMYGFMTMEHLPSAETVRVLGEFLYDERGRPETEEMLLKIVDSDGTLMEEPNSDRAAVSLGRLIANPPYPQRSFVRPSDLEMWKLWYEQVKAGNRTFHFHGDPQEYTLKGPVSAAAVSMPEPGRPVKRPDPSTAATEPAEPSPRSPVMAVFWALLVAAVGYGVWRFRRTAASS